MLDVPYGQYFNDNDLESGSNYVQIQISGEPSYDTDPFTGNESDFGLITKYHWKVKWWNQGYGQGGAYIIDEFWTTVPSVYTAAATGEGGSNGQGWSNVWLWIIPQSGNFQQDQNYQQLDTQMWVYLSVEDTDGNISDEINQNFFIVPQ